MKALDKIYIPFVDLGEDGLCQAPIWWDKNKQDEKPECKGTIEYIRKDALLEWLRKEYETISWYYEKMKHVTGCIGDNSSSGKAEAYKKVIDKIESL